MRRDSSSPKKLCFFGECVRHGDGIEPFANPTARLPVSRPPARRVRGYEIVVQGRDVAQSLPTFGISGSAVLFSASSMSNDLGKQMEVSDYDILESTPEVEDNGTAVRVASFVSLLAGFFFFVTPWTFGRWMDLGAWNCHVAGGIVLALAGTRLLWPLSFRGFSRANAVLAVWIALSPWIFGYTEHGARIANSLALGTALLVSSLLSARVSVMKGTGLAENTWDLPPGEHSKPRIRASGESAV